MVIHFVHWQLIREVCVYSVQMWKLNVRVLLYANDAEFLKVIHNRIYKKSEANISNT